jgi:hypothetical protein
LFWLSNPTLDWHLPMKLLSDLQTSLPPSFSE